MDYALMAGELGVSLANVSSLTAEASMYSAIPFLSLTAYLVKRGIDNYSAVRYLKHRGIKHAVAMSYACDQLSNLIPRIPSTREFKYILEEYNELRAQLDQLLQVLFDSQFFNYVTKKMYDDYAPQGPKKYTTIENKQDLGEMLTEIMSFILVNLELTEEEKKTLNAIIVTLLPKLDTMLQQKSEKENKEWRALIEAIIMVFRSRKLPTNLMVKGEMYIETLQLFPTKFIVAFVNMWTYFERENIERTGRGRSFFDRLKVLTANRYPGLVKIKDDTNFRFSTYILDPIKTNNEIHTLISDLTQYMEIIRGLLQNEPEQPAPGRLFRSHSQPHSNLMALGDAYEQCNCLTLQNLRCKNHAVKHGFCGLHQKCKALNGSKGV